MTKSEARKAVRDWLKHELEDAPGEIEITDLAKRACEVFSTPEHQEIAQALLLDVLYPVIASDARSMLQATRGAKVIEIGGRLTSTEKIRMRTAQALRTKFWTWWEHAGTRHVLFPEMTRVDLIVAASEREQRSSYEATLAGFWRSLAEQLEEGQRVRDRFDEAAICILWARIGDGVDLAQLSS